MTSRICQITLDCGAWEPLVEFWTAVGFKEDPENPNNPGDPEGFLISPEGALGLLFIPDLEPKTGKNRVHLDLVPTDRTRDEETERLVEHGATLLADHRKPDGSGFVRMRDPDGNEFCLAEGESERQDREGLQSTQ